MKRLFVSMLALGAMAAGGAASAQGAWGLGNVLPPVIGAQVLGGAPSLAINPFPYLPPNSGMLPGGTVYQDGNGDLVYMDPRGTQLRLDLARTTDAWGRSVYVDRHGRTVYADPGANVAVAPAVRGGLPPAVVLPPAVQRDRDGDGVPDAYDRYPRNPRWR